MSVITKTSIIIPTKERGSIFDDTLKSVIAASEGLNVEIIVVNDSKVSIPDIPTDAHNVMMVNNSKQGVASARNLGVSLSSGSLLIFMDDDIVIPSHSIAKAINLANADDLKIYMFNWVYPPDVQSFLPQTQFGRHLIKYGFTTLQGWMSGEWSDDDVFEIKGGTSQFLPIKRSVFDAIGGYNESFPHAGAEDYDFIIRAKQYGVRFFLDKTCIFYHNERDRLTLVNWLNRKKRNGETMRLGVEVGHQSLKLEYSGGKRLFLIMLSRSKFLLFTALSVIPNVCFFDPIYFKIIDTLLAVFIFEGYTKGAK